MAVTGSLTAPRDDLMEAFEEYNLSKAQYVADIVFPISPTVHQKATHSRIPRETVTSLEGDIRRKTDGTYARTTLSVEESGYECIEYGEEIAKDDAQVLKLSKDYGLPIDRIAADIVWSQLRRQYEKRVADQVMDPTTNFTAGKGNYTDVSGSNPWATAGSDHVKTVHDAKLKIAARTGEEADTLVCSELQWLNLIHSAQLIGRIQYVKAATFQEIAASIAPMLGLREIIVGKVAYNTTAEGGAFSAARIWSDTYANICVKGKLGVTKLWKDRSPTIVVMEQFRAEDRDSEIVRARHAVDELVLDELYGELLKVA